MSLHDRLPDRLRPWHLLMLAVFVAGAGLSAARNAPFPAGVGIQDLVLFTIEGLFGLVIFQFTVGNVWAAAVEYRNAGGSWRDLPFLAPVVLAVFAAATLYAVSGNVGVAASAAFWVFVGATAVTAVAVNVVVGYTEAE
ncbi:hypothetical protein [Halobaculum lipolyticum]|uniref:Integral membrane protein n=1 Tax=Halobaculum lipolyticum TaxID=3032001 RepID=A0ABD5W8E3_9EURY|nr:hypothetical protein [Halobaculum sp. DT31]